MLLRQNIVLMAIPPEPPVIHRGLILFDLFRVSAIRYERLEDQADQTTVRNNPHKLLPSLSQAKVPERSSGLSAKIKGVLAKSFCNSSRSIVAGSDFFRIEIHRISDRRGPGCIEQAKQIDANIVSVGIAKYSALYYPSPSSWCVVVKPHCLARWA